MEKLDCRNCIHYPHCDQPCVYVDAIIDGKKIRVEPLISNLIGNRDISGRPYTEVIAERMDDLQSRLEYITQIDDPKCRAIGAMLVAGIKRKDICDLICMSHRQLIRIINKNIQLSTLRRVKMA
jgi:hypothetical protein